MRIREMKTNPFFASALRPALVLCLFLIPISMTLDNSIAAIVSPEIEGSSLIMDCQSSKQPVPSQATISHHDLTPSKTVQAQWLAWLNHFFYNNVPSAWFSPSNPAGIRNQMRQVLDGTQSGASKKVTKPSAIDKKNGADSCPAEEEPGLSRLSGSSGLRCSMSMHYLNHRCLHTTICATPTTPLSRCYRNRSLSSNHPPA